MAWRRSSVRARLAPLRGRPDGRPRYVSGLCLVDGALGRLAPELLEAVEIARLGREDVHHDVQVVHEDPARLAEALDPAREQAVLLLEALVDAVVDRLGLAVRVARADHEVVRIAEHALQVELDDVDRL